MFYVLMLGMDLNTMVSYNCNQKTPCYRIQNVTIISNKIFLLEQQLDKIPDVIAIHVKVGSAIDDPFSQLCTNTATLRSTITSNYF